MANLTAHQYGAGVKTKSERFRLKSVAFRQCNDDFLQCITKKGFKIPSSKAFIQTFATTWYQAMFSNRFEEFRGCSRQSEDLVGHAAAVTNDGQPCAERLSRSQRGYPPEGCRGGAAARLQAEPQRAQPLGQAPQHTIADKRWDLAMFRHSCTRFLAGGADFLRKRRTKARDSSRIEKKVLDN